MSHFDVVEKPPRGADIIGSTEGVKVAAFADEGKKYYGVQFHPEVEHTQRGTKILQNFVFSICNSHYSSVFIFKYTTLL